MWQSKAYSESWPIYMRFLFDKQKWHYWRTPMHKASLTLDNILEQHSTKKSSLFKVKRHIL